MTTIEFPEDREKYIGYVELCLGLGLMLGPVLGSAFYNLTESFQSTFYIFGVLIFGGGLFAYTCLPNYLNDDDGKTTKVSARASIVSIGVHAIEKGEEDEDQSLRDRFGNS